jgi:uncharacterized protein YceK
MRAIVIGLIATSALLSGCHKLSDLAESKSQKSQGRYSGVGIFEAGKLWAQVSVPGSASPADPAQAKLADDDYIIAVVDSQTGEVRQCGNHSGYCVTMKPWASTSTAHLPLKLTKHASDLAREEQVQTENSQETR